MFCTFQMKYTKTEAIIFGNEVSKAQLPMSLSILSLIQAILSFIRIKKIRVVLK